MRKIIHAVLVVLVPLSADAHNVAQVQNAKRMTKQTVQTILHLLPSAGSGTTTVVCVGPTGGGGGGGGGVITGGCPPEVCNSCPCSDTACSGDNIACCYRSEGTSPYDKDNDFFIGCDEPCGMTVNNCSLNFAPVDQQPCDCDDDPNGGAGIYPGNGCPAQACVGVSSSSGAVGSSGTSGSSGYCYTVTSGGGGSGGGTGVAGTPSIDPGMYLSYIIEFTPVPNGATLGMNGYVTEYVPDGMEVVGVRFIDAYGHTLPPRLPGAICDDTSCAHATPKTASDCGGANGTLAQVYGDSGVFYSTDPRTHAITTGATGVTDTLELLSGNQAASAGAGVPYGQGTYKPPPGADGVCTNAGGCNTQLVTHNLWDWIQAVALSEGTAWLTNAGAGVPVTRHGSPIAGPDIWYSYEATTKNDVQSYGTQVAARAAVGPKGVSGSTGCSTRHTLGPWHRIAVPGSVGVPFNWPATTTSNDVRVGVPVATGYALSTDHPLPLGTNAVRFAVGELIVGQLYRVEVTLHVLSTPVDARLGRDLNCAEVFGGDASGVQGGGDSVWKYFVPMSSCMYMDLYFDLSTDTLSVASAVTGLIYNLSTTNLSSQQETNATIVFSQNNVLQNCSILSGATGAIAPTFVWGPLTLDPGQSFNIKLSCQAKAEGEVFATYTSDQHPTNIVYERLNFGTYTAITIAGGVDPEQVSPSGITHYTFSASESATSNDVPDHICVALPTGVTLVSGSALISSFGPPQNPANPTSCSGVTCGVGACVNGRCMTSSTTPKPNCVNGTSCGAGHCEWDAPGNLPVGGQLRIEFDAKVAKTMQPGVYTSTVTYDDKVGKELLLTRPGLAPLYVGILRSAPPVIDGPLFVTSPGLTGRANSIGGSVVTLYLNGVVAGTGRLGDDGKFEFATLPPLFNGENVTATVQAPGEEESAQSTPVVVGGVLPQVCDDTTPSNTPGCCDAAITCPTGNTCIASFCMPTVGACTANRQCDAGQRCYGACLDGTSGGLCLDQSDCLVSEVCLNGSCGAPPPTGTTGVTGNTGSSGVTGSTGTTGASGASGPIITTGCLSDADCLAGYYCASGTCQPMAMSSGDGTTQPGNDEQPATGGATAAAKGCKCSGSTDPSALLLMLLVVALVRRRIWR